MKLSEISSDSSTQRRVIFQSPSSAHLKRGARLITELPPAERK
jgi:hypothetical protein